jgi:hypothetical protein
MDPEEPAALPSGRKRIALYAALPLVAMGMVWLWINDERGALRDRGAIACNDRKHDEAWCKQAADRHHGRCVELTFTPATRTSGSAFDTNGYVECLDVGPEEYGKLSTAREAARRRVIIPSGPSYH